MTTVFNDLKKRVVTGLLLASVFTILLLLAHFFIAGRWLLISLVFFVELIACMEFSRAIGKTTAEYIYSLVILILPLFVGFGLICLLGEAFSGFIGGAFIFASLAFILGIFLLFASIFVGKYSYKHLLSNLLLGLFFLIFCGILLNSTLLANEGIKHVVWLILVVCVNDSAAYFGGSYFKGIKLSPNISPGKTVSGSICGIIGGLMIGFIMAPMISFNRYEWSFYLICIIVICASQLGDLTKSFIKRQCQIKDFGAILPGHGGVIDRIDGVLMSMPYFYAFLTLTQIFE